MICLSVGYELDVLGEFRDFLNKEHVASFVNVALSLFQRWQETLFFMFTLLSSSQEVDVLLISHSSFN